MTNKNVQAAKDDDPGNPTVDFHGEKRCNDTHQSTTDPESVLYRKAKGKEAKLCFGGHILMENRHGLVRRLYLAQSDQRTRTGHGAATVGRTHATASRHPTQDGWGPTRAITKKLLCRAAATASRAPCRLQGGVQVPGLDGRTTTKPGYQTSQRIRKRVEEIFGWIKTVGGLRRSSLPRTGTNASLGLLCGGNLQSAADGATGIGNESLRRRMKTERPKSAAVRAGHKGAKSLGGVASQPILACGRVLF